MRPQTVRRVGLAFFAFFCLLTLLLTKYSSSELDRSISERLQAVLPETLDPFFSLFSVLGAFELQTAIFLAILFSFRPGWKKTIFYFGAYTLGTLIEMALKFWLPHGGPTKELFRYDLPLVFASSHVYTGHSYPSGHSFRSAYLIILLFMESQFNLNWKVQRKKIQLLLCSFLGLMLLTRVSLGEHWFTDVVGGATLGVAGALLVWSFVGKRN